MLFPVFFVGEDFHKSPQPAVKSNGCILARITHFVSSTVSYFPWLRLALILPRRGSTEPVVLTVCCTTPSTPLCPCISLHPSTSWGICQAIVIDVLLRRQGSGYSFMLRRLDCVFNLNFSHPTFTADNG